ncbi:MAG: hypothetical protein ABIQ32_02005 [Sphingomicrobium sp.]
MIACYYADAVELRLASEAELKAVPREDSKVLARLPIGAVFRLLENKLGWAWGYAADGWVGYVKSEALQLD